MTKTNYKELWIDERNKVDNLKSKLSFRNNLLMALTLVILMFCVGAGMLKHEANQEINLEFCGDTDIKFEKIYLQGSLFKDDIENGFSCCETIKEFRFKENKNKWTFDKSKVCSYNTTDLNNESYEIDYRENIINPIIQ